MIPTRFVSFSTRKKKNAKWADNFVLVVSDAIFLIVIFININISNGSYQYHHPIATVVSVLNHMRLPDDYNFSHQNEPSSRLAIIFSV